MKKSLKFSVVFSIAIFFMISLIYLSIILINSTTQPASNSLNSDLFTVIDGDTFILNNETIRLLCVQTPEIGQEGYESAKLYLQSLLSQGPISLKTIPNIDKDIYNRSLRFVFVNTASNISVNQLIIENGFGVLYSYNNTDCSALSSQ